MFGDEAWAAQGSYYEQRAAHASLPPGVSGQAETLPGLPTVDQPGREVPTNSAHPQRASGLQDRWKWYRTMHFAPL